MLVHSIRRTFFGTYSYSSLVEAVGVFYDPLTLIHEMYECHKEIYYLFIPSEHGDLCPGIWVRANLLTFPWLFWVILSILTMLWSGWSSRFFLWFPILTVSLPSPLWTVPSAPVIVGITVTHVFPSYFNSLALSKYFSIVSLPFNFTLWSAGSAKSIWWQVHFSFFIKIRSSLPAEIE